MTPAQNILYFVAGAIAGALAALIAISLVIIGCRGDRHDIGPEEHDDTHGR